MRRSRGLLIFAVVALANGCRKRSVDLVTRSLEHDGRDRTYHVHLPPGHSPAKPVPLVVALHGGGGTGLGFEAGTGAGLRAESDRRGWVIVYPEGIEKGWNDGRPLSSARDVQRAGVDDVGFLAALIARLHADHGIDRSRVFFTGISNGGFMSMRFAIDHPSQLAAIAAVTANLAKLHETRKLERPVPVLIMNGTDDPLVPWAGGQVRVLGRDRGEVLSTLDTIRWWTAQNGCAGAPVQGTLPDLVPDDGTRVHTEIHGSCQDRSEVALYRIEGGGHTWPGGAQYLPERVIGRVSRDFEGTRAIFDFFARH